MNAKISLSICTKNGHWNFDRHCVESVHVFGVLTNIKRSLYEHWMSSHLISFSNFCSFYRVNLLPPWVVSGYVFPRYLNLLDAVLSGSVFFISFSDYLLFL